MDSSKLKTSKLEKGFIKTLPFWSRIKNKILNVSDFFDGIHTFFEMAIGALIILPFVLVFGPFVLLYQIIGYYVFGKR